MSHRGAAVPEREGGRGRKPCPKREDFRPKEKGAAPRDRPFLCPVCPIGSESDAETDREGVEIRSEEHTSELQSLMRISYAVFCLKKKNKNNNRITRSS